MPDTLLLRESRRHRLSHRCAFVEIPPSLPSFREILNSGRVSERVQALLEGFERRARVRL